MKILFVTGSRGEWGYIKPILNIIDSDPSLNYSLCVTNMHLMPELGLSVKEIENIFITLPSSPRRGPRNPRP